MFFAAIMGNFTYGVSILTRVPITVSYIKPRIPYLLGRFLELSWGGKSEVTDSLILQPGDLLLRRDHSHAILLLPLIRQGIIQTDISGDLISVHRPNSFGAGHVWQSWLWRESSRSKIKNITIWVNLTLELKSGTAMGALQLGSKGEKCCKNTPYFLTASNMSEGQRIWFL